jgi:hypothetical protein
VLFNEPKLLKSAGSDLRGATRARDSIVSVLFNEPKLLKSPRAGRMSDARTVSVLFNEPKLLKSNACFHSDGRATTPALFSALQRAEIAEIVRSPRARSSSVKMFQCSSTSRNC